MLMPVQCSNCHENVQLLPAGAATVCCPVSHVAKYTAPYSYSHHYSSHQLPLPARPMPPYSQLPPGPPTLGRGYKRVVICAVSYTNYKHEVKGCINDANCWELLAEEETDPNRHPIKQNMIRALHWPVQGCQPGDCVSLFRSWKTKEELHRG
ncbi:hypothetical protein ACFX1S_041963 [Malus domestica]